MFIYCTRYPYLTNNQTILSSFLSICDNFEARGLIFHQITKLSILDLKKTKKKMDLIEIGKKIITAIAPIVAVPLMTANYIVQTVGPTILKKFEFCFENKCLTDRPYKEMKYPLDIKREDFLQNFSQNELKIILIPN